VSSDRRWFKCFGCGEKGDAATLVKKLNDVGFAEAIRWLDERYGTGNGTVQSLAVMPAKATRPSPQRSSGLPADSALALASAAALRLWTPEGRHDLDYLRRRGLTDETIRAARLGSIAAARFPTRGIAIPWFDREDRLCLLKVRQPDGCERRYAEAFRDRPLLYPGRDAIEPGKPLIACEGELDCLLLAQQLPEATVITLGSASAKPDPDVLAALLFASPWYIALDADQAGDRAAADWPATAIGVRPPDPFGDWSEAGQAGVNLRCWWLPHLGGSEALWNELKTWRWGPAKDE
jgi:DNA primase